MNWTVESHPSFKDMKQKSLSVSVNVLLRHSVGVFATGDLKRFVGTRTMAGAGDQSPVCTLLYSPLFQ